MQVNLVFNDGVKTSDMPPPHLDALDEAIRRTGLGKLAKAAGVRYQQVQGWRANGRKFATPAEYVLKVEAASGVSRHDLRPDLYPATETA